MTDDHSWEAEHGDVPRDSNAYESHDDEGEENDEAESFANPPTSQVRISAVEAAVAAGLAPSTSRISPSSEALGEVENPIPTVELPDWMDPPTGQVPRVLLDEGDDLGLVTRGPSWRQESADWDEEVDLSIFADDSPPDFSAEIAGQAEETDEHPYEFGDLGLGGADLSADTNDDEAWTQVLSESAPEPEDAYGLSSFGPASLGDFGRRSHRRKGAHRSRSRSTEVSSDASDDATTPVPRPERTPRTKSDAGQKHPLRATATGLLIAAIAAVCLALGSVTSLVLVVVVLLLASGEAFSALRRVGFQPASLPGLAIVAALTIATYLRGPSGPVFVLGLGIVITSVVYLSGRGGDRPVVNLSATLGIICWVGVLGSFAGLLLAPSQHPHRHGIALVLGAILVTVAHDVGSYAVGSRFGRRLLAPMVSPNKTIEGLIGGTLLGILVGVLVGFRIHPFTVTLGIELAIVIAILAPVGDLVESLIKRDLGIKDMGNLLPGHGGVLDRIDALLFVLPATYYLASVHHIG